MHHSFHEILDEKCHSQVTAELVEQRLTFLILFYCCFSVLILFRFFYFNFDGVVWLVISQEIHTRTSLKGCHCTRLHNIRLFDLNAIIWLGLLVHEVREWTAWLFLNWWWLWLNHYLIRRCIFSAVLGGQNFHCSLHFDLNLYLGIVLYYLYLCLYIPLVRLAWILFRFVCFVLFVRSTIAVRWVRSLFHLISSFAFGCLLFDFYIYINILFNWFERPAVATACRRFDSSIFLWFITINFLLLLTILAFLFGLF